MSGRTNQMIDHVVASDKRTIFVFCATDRECDRIMRLTLEKLKQTDTEDTRVFLPAREIQRGDRTIRFLAVSHPHIEERLMGIEASENSMFWDHYAAIAASQRLKDCVSAICRSR